MRLMILVGPEKRNSDIEDVGEISSYDMSFFRRVFSSVLKDYEKNPSDFLSHDFLFGKFPVRVIYPADSDFKELSNALNHLKSNELEGEILTIFCIDCSVKGFSLPFVPWSERFKVYGKEIPYYRKGGMFLSRSPESEVLSFLDQGNKIAIYWTADYKTLADYEKAAPFRTLLQWWFELKGCEMVHSAAVGVEGVCALLSGGGGSGKSTTSVNCLYSGMNFLGDDYVLICKNGKYKVSSIYNSAKLDEKSLSILQEPNLLPDARNINNKGKKVVFFNQYMRHRLKKTMELACIIIPVISGSLKTEVKKIPPSECFKALAPSTVFQHVNEKKQLIKFLFELANSVPCYKAFLGTDYQEIAEKIRRVIKENNG